jgi:hypothetical protein
MYVLTYHIIFIYGKLMEATVFMLLGGAQVEIILELRELLLAISSVQWFHCQYLGISKACI